MLEHLFFCCLVRVLNSNLFEFIVLSLSLNRNREEERERKGTQNPSPTQQPKPTPPSPFPWAQFTPLLFPARPDPGSQHGSAPAHTPAQLAPACSRSPASRSGPSRTPAPTPHSAPRQRPTRRPTCQRPRSLSRAPTLSATPGPRVSALLSPSFPAPQRLPEITGEVAGILIPLRPAAIPARPL